MKLLFIGDVVGKSGCDFLAANIFKIKKENSTVGLLEVRFAKIADNVR